MLGRLCLSFACVCECVGVGVGVGMDKGSVWVNGFSLGRCWEAAGPQVCVLGASLCVWVYG